MTNVSRLKAITKKKPGLLLALAACSLVLIGARGLLSSRLDQSGDHLYHLGCEGQVALAIDHGKSPFSPVSVNFGTPVLKFYQPLFYLVVGGLASLTGADLILIHNLLAVILYALTPLALWWGFNKIGLSDLASGLAALLSLSSVAGFGSSFEANFTTGVVTQVPGALFLPLFMGSFAEFLKAKKKVSPVPSAVFFALATISHAMMAVYSVLLGFVLLFSGYWDLKRIWKKLLLFPVLASMLSAFWIVPFLSHQWRHRPVPDAVLAGQYLGWANGLTPGQAFDLLFTGRLLDDARLPKKPNIQRSAEDELTDRINIAGTIKTRPPFLTVMVLLGFMLSCTRLWSLPHRFMVTGFLFSFLLLMGPDDVAWLKWLPFSKRLQFFRCVYLLELFGFGLAALGLEKVSHYLFDRANALEPGLKKPAIAALWIACIAAASLFAYHVLDLARRHVTPGSTKKFDYAVQVASATKSHFALRMALNNGHFRTDKRRIGYMQSKGLRAVCGHWRMLGPAMASVLCRYIRVTAKYLDVARLSGVGHYLVNRRIAGRLNKMTDSDGEPVFRQIRRGHGLYLYRDLGAEYGWTAPNAALVIADDSQWFTLAWDWVTEIANARQRPYTPVRLEPGLHVDKTLLGAFESVWVLNRSLLDSRDVRALSDYSFKGGEVLSLEPIQGLNTKVVQPGSYHLLESRPAGQSRGTRLEQVGYDVGGPVSYNVSANKPTVVVLPEFAVQGWKASVDRDSVPVLSAGPDMVAAIVPKGNHELVFSWSTPWNEMFCSSLSALAWVAVSAYLLAGVLKRRAVKP